MYASGSIGAGNVGSLAAGDINGDGVTDFVATSSTATTVSTYLSNRGSSTFTLTTATANGSGSTAHVNDLNNDGFADVTLHNNTWAQNLLSSGNGVTAQTVFDGFASVPNVIHMFDMRFGDMDNDGLLDMVVGGGINGEISIVRNNGNGTWGNVLMQLSGAQTQALGIASGGITTVNVADMNGDGVNDLIAHHAANGIAYVLTGGGNYSYTLTQSIANGAGGSSRITDFNNDGRMDLLTAVSGTRRVFVNQSQVGEEGSFRVSEGSGSTDNVGYRAGAITLNSLADQLAYARITTRQSATKPRI